MSFDLLYETFDVIYKAFEVLYEAFEVLYEAFKLLYELFVCDMRDSFLVSSRLIGFHVTVIPRNRWMAGLLIILLLVLAVVWVRLCSTEYAVFAPGSEWQMINVVLVDFEL